MELIADTLKDLFEMRLPWVVNRVTDSHHIRTGSLHSKYMRMHTANILISLGSIVQICTYTHLQHFKSTG